MTWLNWMSVLLIAGPVCATELPSAGQTQSIWLHEEDGTSIEVAKITFESSADGLNYTIDWKDDIFTDQFLSMRPFKCLDGTVKQWCRVPYPYDNKQNLAVQDVTDLEYDLLFVWKDRTDYGIDMWNGVYYKLSASGGQFLGEMHEMDMDILSAPPDDGNLRPIRDVDIEPADPSSHWLPVLTIE